MAQEQGAGPERPAVVSDGEGHAPAPASKTSTPAPASSETAVPDSAGPPAVPSLPTAASQADMILALIGDVPAGETVTVVFDATVVDPVPSGVSSVATQGTVTFVDFPSVLTDDPDTVAPDDPTATLLDVPCVPALTPTSAVVVSGGAIGNTFDVTAPSTCSWSATPSAPFITVTGGATGMGNGTVTYDVAANGTALTVSGTITVAGTTGDPSDGSADFTVNQQAATCTLNLNPASSGPLAGAGGASSFAVETLPGCNWTAVSSDPALTVTGGASGAGPGNVDFSVAANPTALARNFAVTVTVSNNGIMAAHATSQSGAACTLTLDPTSTNLPAAGGSGSFAVQTLVGCSWTAGSPDADVTITGGASGSGNGTVTFDVAANPLTTPRNFGITVVVGGSAPTANHTIAQAPLVCTPVLTPAGTDVPAAGGGGSFDVTVSAGCAWTATPSDAAVTINAGAAGSGNGTVTFDVAANPLAAPRSLEIVLAASGGSSATHTITQAPLVCSPVLTPSAANIPAAGGSGNFDVSAAAGCGWTATPSDAAVTITSGATGMGNGAVAYDVGATPGPARSFTIDLTFAPTGEIASHAINQGAAVCSFTLSPSAASYPGEGGGGTVTVTASSPDCDWTASSNADWLVVASGSMSGTGDGTVLYTVLPSNWAVPRDAALTIGEETFNVHQEAGVCTFAISPVAIGYGLFAGANPVAVDTGVGCTWTAVSNDDWISVDAIETGTGAGTATIGVKRNETGASRTGTVTIAENTLTVTQSNDDSGAFILAPLAVAFPGAGGGGNLLVSAPSTIDWTAVPDSDWITIVGAVDGLGAGIVSYVVAPNPAPVMRSGAINVGGRFFSIVQAPAGESTIQIWIAEAPAEAAERHATGEAPAPPAGGSR